VQLLGLISFQVKKDQGRNSDEKEVYELAFKIFLSPPNMCGEELKFVQEAFDTNWIAPYGPSLTKFEQEMADYIGVASALAVSSGTAGIHLALRYLNVEHGDIVFCSDLTFAGSCNPILYQSATPVFIDSEPDSWNMSPVALQKAFDWAEKEGKLPKAVIIVDLYGESADYDDLHYEHKEYGYNYRMSNICAAIGRGQLTFLNNKIKQRKLIHETYVHALEGTTAYVKEPSRKCVSNYWISLMVLCDGEILPDKIVMNLQNAEIEARPAWKPMHMQPVFKDSPCFSHGDAFFSEQIFKHAVCLPSGDKMSADQQQVVIDELNKCLCGNGELHLVMQERREAI